MSDSSCCRQIRWRIGCRYWVQIYLSGNRYILADKDRRSISITHTPKQYNPWIDKNWRFNCQQFLSRLMARTIALRTSFNINPLIFNYFYRHKVPYFCSKKTKKSGHYRTLLMFFMLKKNIPVWLCTSGGQCCSSQPIRPLSAMLFPSPIAHSPQGVL